LLFLSNNPKFGNDDEDDDDVLHVSGEEKFAIRSRATEAQGRVPELRAGPVAGRGGGGASNSSSNDDDNDDEAQQ
jgi:hypothetical protein